MGKPSGGQTDTCLEVEANEGGHCVGLPFWSCGRLWECSGKLRSPG